MPKTIVFCADGTWNSPGQDENKDGTPDQTNVYKLFLALNGEISQESILNGDEQEKVFLEDGGNITQIAKYIHGVGDSKNPIHKLFGGATGAGTISRIVRGYTFISRNYEPGDSIIIVGFSRGAYTARALGGLIASKGLIEKGQIKYEDKFGRESAYITASKVWFDYARSLKNDGVQASLISVISYLPGFISSALGDNVKLNEVKKIKAIAVWDTVGALGIPDIFGDGERHDAFCFANTALSKKVQYGFHAISLDEQRKQFIPTLWDEPKIEDQIIKQLLFPGAHADVGGGYPEDKLSNIPLEWMIEQLRERCGVSFNQIKFDKDIKETAHEPWHGSILYRGKTGKRNFAGYYVSAHSSIEERKSCGSVRPDPSKKATTYAPPNWP